MKREIMKLALCFAVCVAFIGCTKETDGGGEEYNDATYRTGYLVNEYIVGLSAVSGTKINSSRDDVYGNLPENSIILLQLTSDSDVEHITKSSEEKFIELAQKNGEQGNYTDWTYIGLNKSIGLDIEDIKIWAANDFNENYASGSELTDIARITYSSFMPFIDNNYEEIMPDMELYSNGGLPRLGITWAPNTYPYYNVELPQSGKNPIILPSASNLSGNDVSIACVSFLEAPTTSTPQFDVSVTFEDGTVLRNTFEIVISD